MLTYTGTRGAHSPGIPARDLSEDEVKALAAEMGLRPKTLVKHLTRHGLYALTPPPPEPDESTEEET